jgi:hypothetical protein
VELTIKVTVKVTDVVGSPVSGADISFVLSEIKTNGTSDGQGNFSPSPVPVTYSSFQVDVTHPAYLPETVEVFPRDEGKYFLWDNPVCSVTASGTVTVRLSVLHAAPTLFISNPELKDRAPFNPQAVFTWTDNAGNRTGRYLALFNGENLIVPISHPLLPDKPRTGWNRFNHGGPVKCDPSRTGNLVWLEWGLGEKKPRLLVAVWVPRFPGPTPTQLDFVIFFSPNTAAAAGFPADKFPWLDQYPYMATRTPPTPQNPDPMLRQPYPSLGQRYLFHEKLLIYQLLAARCQAIVIFPIQPFGDWGPFGQAAGLARLIGEVSHLLRRTGLTYGGETSRDEDRALSVHQRFGRLTMHMPLPQVRRVVLSGFSAGVAPIVNMLDTSYGQKLVDSRPGLDHALFGADVAPFLKAWMEVWDHDAPCGVRKAMEEAVPRWMKQNNQRILRCYQSQYTGTPENWVEITPLTQFTPGAVKPPVDAGGHKAAERHADARCSLVYFGSGYLKHAIVFKF